MTNKNKNNEKTEFLGAGSRSVAGIVQPGRRAAKQSEQQRGSEADDHHRLPATDGMQIRAAGDDSGDAAATRCYVQILNGDGTELEDGNSVPIEMTPNGSSFTTTVDLNGANTYDFLFWADTETTSDDQSNAPADLRAVAYTNGETIAWAGKIDNRPWTAEDIEITLEHVVSRVTVITTSDFPVEGDYSLTVNVPTVYNKYNVAEMKVVADSQVSDGYTHDVTDNIYEANAEVDHFYVLGDGNNQLLKLWYYGPKKNPEIRITDVPVSANTHITLKGDIYNTGMVEGNIKATTSTGWNTPEEGDIDIDKY